MKTLERHLGPVYVTAISLGAMLGAGLFVLPGIAAKLTEANLWLAFLVAGICVIPGAVSKAELATAMPSSGGTYLYIERAFGPLAGTVGGVGLWLSLIMKGAFALIGLSWYLSEVVMLPKIPTALVLLCSIVVLNLMGVRKVGKAQTWMVGVALLGVVFAIPSALKGFRPELFIPIETATSVDFFAGVALVYTAFAGVTKIAAVAEEVKNPSVTLPLGILLSLVLATLIYCGACYLLVGVLDASAATGTSPRGAPGLQGDYHAMFTFAREVGGPIFGTVMAVLGVVIIFAQGNACVLASSRFPFAMSRDKLVPSVFGQIHAKYMTPTVAIVATGLVMALLIVSLDVVGIAKLASSLKIAIFIAVNLCVVVFRETGTNWYRPTFRSPFYPALQIAGIVVGFILLYMLGPSGVAALVGMVLPGTLIFLLYGRRHTQSQGVVSLRGPRKDLKLEAAQALVEHREMLPQDAKVVVALLGNERSPETLAEVGGFLAEGSAVDVLQVTDVPEQVTLDSMLEEDPFIESLRRRVMNLGESKGLKVAFDPVVTRDAVRTVHETTLELDCQWLVMEWQEPSKRRVFQTHPIGWLGDHLSCNFGVFRDRGIRSFHEILVLPKPGPHDALVVRAAEQFASIHNARLILARYVPEGADELASQSAGDYLEQLRQLCGENVSTSWTLLRGKSEDLAVSHASAACDLMVLGAPPERGFIRQMFESRADRLTRKAACSVLQVKTPRKRFHSSVRSSRVHDESGTFALSRYLVPECVSVSMALNRKEQVFSTISQAFTQVIPTMTAKEIEQALWSREEMQNTGVGEGVAIPHATLPGVQRSYLGVFTTSKPVSYGASDERGVDVFFVTVGPPEERKTHLLMLSNLARLVSTDDFLGQLRGLRESREVIDLFQIAQKEESLE